MGVFRVENIPDLFLAWPLCQAIVIGCVRVGAWPCLPLPQGVSEALRADPEADPLLGPRDIDPTQPVQLWKEYFCRCLEVFIWNKCINCEMHGLERQECVKHIKADGRCVI